MEISRQKLKALLERAWELGASAEGLGIDEPALEDTEIEGLIDSADEEET